MEKSHFKIGDFVTLDSEFFGKKEFDSEGNRDYFIGCFYKLSNIFAEESINFEENYSKFFKNKILQIKEIIKIKTYPGYAIFFSGKDYGFHEGCFRLATPIEIMKWRIKHEIQDPQRSYPIP